MTAHPPRHLFSPDLGADVLSYAAMLKATGCKPSPDDTQKDNSAQSFSPSPSSTITELFARGVAWLYAFHHEAAIECFEAVLQMDPTVGIARWGIAYALGPNYNDLNPDEERKVRGIAQVKEARTCMFLHFLGICSRHSRPCLPRPDPPERSLVTGGGVKKSRIPLCICGRAALPFFVLLDSLPNGTCFCSCLARPK